MMALRTAYQQLLLRAINEGYVSPVDKCYISDLLKQISTIPDGSSEELTNAEFSAGRHRIVSQLPEPTPIDHGDRGPADKKNLYCHWC